MSDDLDSTVEPLRSTDVALRFGVDPATVTRWAREGKLPSFRTPGGGLRFRRSDIEALLADGIAS